MGLLLLVLLHRASLASSTRCRGRSRAARSASRTHHRVVLVCARPLGEPCLGVYECRPARIGAGVVDLGLDHDPVDGEILHSCAHGRVGGGVRGLSDAEGVKVAHRTKFRSGKPLSAPRTRTRPMGLAQPSKTEPEPQPKAPIPSNRHTGRHAAAAMALRRQAPRSIDRGRGASAPCCHYEASNGYARCRSRLPRRRDRTRPATQLSARLGGGDRARACLCVPAEAWDGATD